MTIYPRARFANILKAEGVRDLILIKRSGWDEPAEVLPHRWRWGHGGVDVFPLSQRNVLGPTTHVFDDVDCAPMQLASEVAPLRRLCDVYLKPFGGAAPMAV
jgi:hypothetical protein